MLLVEHNSPLEMVRGRLSTARRRHLAFSSPAHMVQAQIHALKEKRPDRSKTNETSLSAKARSNQDPPSDRNRRLIE